MKKKPGILSISFILLLGACGGTESTKDITWPETLKTQVGQTYEIRWTQSSEQTGGSRSSGSSNSRSTHIERVLEAEPNELVLEYDMPARTSDAGLRRQLPARIRITPDNKMTLLNANDLKARNDDWLDLRNFNQSHCGRWLFTCTAVKIECDPSSVIDTLETIDIRRANLKAGASYTSFAGLNSAVLIQEPSEGDTIKLSALLGAALAGCPFFGGAPPPANPARMNYLASFLNAGLAHVTTPAKCYSVAIGLRTVS